MKRYRVTKYNPENRDLEGSYLLDEWTCPSEVGRLFNGAKFEESEYFDTESKYVGAAVKLIKSISLNHLRIVNLKMSWTAECFTDENKQWLLEDEFKTIDLYEDKAVDISEIETVIKMLLRDYIGCSLEIDGKFELFFGYDFYMYVSILDINPETIDEIRKLGLFVEELGLIPAESNYQFYVDIAAKDEDQEDEDTLFLEDMTKDKLRKGLGLSVEHPCTHCFEITNSNYLFFSSQVNFDFDKNRYFFTCDNDVALDSQ